MQVNFYERGSFATDVLITYSETLQHKRIELKEPFRTTADDQLVYH